MPFLSYIFATLLVLSGAAAASLWNVQASAQASIQEVSAATMRVTAGIVRSYMAVNLTKEGEISMQELAPYTPTWFNGDSRVRTIGKGGRGYIFITAESGNKTASNLVADSSDMPVTLGIAQSGKLISPVAGTVLLDIPDIIPNGSLVYVI